MPVNSSEPPGFPPEIPTPPSIPELDEVMVRCTRCDLFLSRTQVVPGAGSLRPRALFVGEAPGASEDREGVPFVGRSGALLESMLAEANLTRDEIFIANVVRCRPEKNRNPRAAELRACSGWLQEQVRLLAPAVVVTLGRYALQHFLPGGKITELEGQLLQVAYPTGPLAIFPLVHPSAVLRDPRRRPEYQRQFQSLGELLVSEKPRARKRTGS